MIAERVKVALREFEASLKLKRVKEEKGESRGGPDQALYGKGGKDKKEKGEKCKKCGRWGHGERECYTRCYECGEIGHMASKCPKKDNKPKEKSTRGMSALAFAGDETPVREYSV